MRDFKVGSHVIKFYDDVESLPIWRYQAFTRRAVVEACTRPTGSSVQDKIGMLAKLITSGKTEDAIIELQNISMTFANMESGNIPAYDMLSWLVFSIDKEIVNPEDPDCTERLAKILKFATKKDVEELIDGLKKN